MNRLARDEARYKSTVTLPALPVLCCVGSAGQVSWYHNGRRFVAERPADELQQSYRDLDGDGGGVVSTVRLGRLRPRHAGNWTCDARVPARQHQSRSVDTLHPPRPALRPGLRSKLTVVTSV